MIQSEQRERSLLRQERQWKYQEVPTAGRSTKRAETQNLIASIKNGEVVTREPAYEKTAASHAAQDWGTTYLEVDLSAQHMWYIVNGAIALETDVVTGLPDAEACTTQAVYIRFFIQNRIQN